MKISFRFAATPASNATRAQRRRSLFLAAVGIAVLPLAWHGASCGHDFNFHLESWLETVRHWHEGVLYSHWAASANYGTGEPRFVFYPPLSWMLGGLLGALLPWTWVPLIFSLLTLLGLGWSFFTMAREWMPEDNAALAACVYVLNPYILFVAYERTAYGELLGGVWMPLLVLFALRKSPSLLPLSVVIAALWLTNAPAAVMGCYALVLIVIVAAITEHRWALLLRSAGALLLGLGLACFYLVPAIYEQRWVEITRAISSGMRVEDSFLFGYTGETFHDQVLHTASWIAVLLMASTAIAAWLSVKRRSSLWTPLVALAATFVLLLPFSDPVWRYLPELRYLQFPWRWLLVLSLVLAALAGLALRGEADTRRAISLRALVILLLAIGMSAFTATHFWQPCDEEDNVRAQVAAFHDDGFAGTDEYTTGTADNGDIQQHLPPIRIIAAPDGDEADSSVQENPEWNAEAADKVPAEVRIERWQSERMAATVTTSAPGYAVLRLMDYPAWRIRVNGSSIEARAKRDDGLIAFPLHGGQNHIDVQYVATTDTWLGRALSFASLLLWLGLAWREKRGRKLQVL